MARMLARDRNSKAVWRELFASGVLTQRTRGDRPALNWTVASTAASIITGDRCEIATVDVVGFTFEFSRGHFRRAITLGAGNDRQRGNVLSGTWAPDALSIIRLPSVASPALSFFLRRRTTTGKDRLVAYISPTCIPFRSAWTLFISMPKRRSGPNCEAVSGFRSIAMEATSSCGLDLQRRPPFASA